MSVKTATETEWAAAIDGAYWAQRDAQKTLQNAIDAGVRALTLEARFHGEAGNARASRLAAKKARLLSRTSAVAVTQFALGTGIWRRLFWFC